MTKKPGLKARRKSIQAAMAAAQGGKASPVDQAAKVAADTASAKTGSLEVSPVADAALAARSRFPEGEDDVRVLEERARLYARQPKARQSAHGGDTFVQVSLGGDDRYGIPFQYADEVVSGGEITPVPGTPAHVAGVVNLRGTLLTVVDVRPLIGLDARSEIAGTRIVVVAARDVRFGILVADVDGSVVYAADALAPPIAGKGGHRRDAVLGIHNGTVAVFDIEGLTAIPALTVDQGS